MALDPIQGGLEGWLSGKKTSGRDTGNALNLNPDDTRMAQEQLGNLMRYQDDPNIVDPIKGSRTATSEVQNNDILGQLYGKGGTLSRTVGEEQNLAQRGYSLKPEDHEAYGQASDNIAREFGNSEGNLAQALSQRGLSGSSVAGQSFSGLQGNKMERLGAMQRQIANDRMKSNMDRLGQTRQFLNQMSGQAGNEIQGQYNRQMEGANTQFGRLQDKNAAAQSRLTAQANQGNINMQQRAGSEQTSDWAKTGLGASQGFTNGGLFALDALTGGSSGASKNMKSTDQATGKKPGGIFGG